MAGLCRLLPLVSVKGSHGADAAELAFGASLGFGFALSFGGGTRWFAQPAVEVAVDHANGAMRPLLLQRVQKSATGLMQPICVRSEIAFPGQSFAAVDFPAWRVYCARERKKK